VRSPSPAKLSAIDLNLLVALDALLAERNVTRAGKKVGLTQSSMSHALKRLRELFGDPLLVKSGHDLHPTTLAEELAPKITHLMRELRETLLERVSFEPELDARTFTIATNDYCGSVLIPQLVAHLRRAAPHVDLRIRALAQQGPFDALTAGEIDVAIGTFLQPPPYIESLTLFEEAFVCMVAKKKRPLSLEELAAHDHVLISSPGEGPGIVDFALAKQGLSRRVAVRVPFFSVAPAIVAETDYVLTVPARLARIFEASHRLRSFPPPLPLDGFSVTMWWHARTERDPARRWLREQVLAISAELSSA
jgi:DNA-binding transcriptional LysR family regulator